MNNANVYKSVWTLCLCGLIYVTAGCVSVRPVPAPLTGYDDQTASDLLRKYVDDFIETANQTYKNDQTLLRSARPYYYRVSEFYPKGAGQYRSSVRRLPGNRAQFEAVVALPCQRTMTRYHRSRAAANKDEQLIREDGTLNAVLTLTGREWRVEYSYFEPTVTKTFTNGEWVETPFVADRFVEDKPGIFRRMFGWIL